MKADAMITTFKSLKQFKQGKVSGVAYWLNREIGQKATPDTKRSP
jgi:hypothetical protein